MAIEHDGNGDLRAVDGRLPGRRGRATREKLLRCTEELLQTTSYRDLKVIDIARCAGTSPATFYQYFPDAQTAILVLAGAMAEEGAELAGLVRRGPWTGKGSESTARTLVDGFIDIWERHSPLLRVVDLATAEGDLRFRNIRTNLLNQITDSLRDVIADFSVKGRHPADIDPLAHGASVVSLLAHVAAHRYGFEFWGIRIDDVRRSTTRMVHWGVTGRAPAD